MVTEGLAVSFRSFGSVGCWQLVNARAILSTIAFLKRLFVMVILIHSASLKMSLCRLRYQQKYSNKITLFVVRLKKMNKIKH